MTEIKTFDTCEIDKTKNDRLFPISFCCVAWGINKRNISEGKKCFLKRQFRQGGKFCLTDGGWGAGDQHFVEKNTFF